MLEAICLNYTLSCGD